MFKKLLLVIALFVTLPSLVSADVGYEIESVKVTAELNEEGKVSVREILTLNFENQPEEFVRKIPRRIEFLDIEGKLNPKNATLSIKGLPPVEHKVRNRGNYMEVVLKKEDGNLSKSKEVTIEYELDTVAEEEIEYVVYLLKGQDQEIDIGWAEYTLISKGKNIFNVKCFAGNIESAQGQCVSEFDGGRASVKSATKLDKNKDFLVIMEIGEPEDISMLASNISGKNVNMSNIVLLGITLLVIVTVVVFVKRKDNLKVLVSRFGKKKTDRIED